MYYAYNGTPISSPSAYQGRSFRDGLYWYKVFTDEEECKREAKTLSAVYSCPGTVKMINWGILEEHRDDGETTTYYAIKEEFIIGDSFEEYARTNHDEKKGVILFIKIAHILSELYVREIIHNDIKPSNIVVDYDGNPLLIDFGISKALNEPIYEHHTKISEHFSAPEKVLKEANPVTVQSDIYSFGQLMKYFMDQNPDRGAASYSKGFRAIWEKCKQRYPQDRFSSFEEIEKALSQIQIKMTQELQRQKKMGDSPVIVRNNVPKLSLPVISIVLYIISACIIGYACYLILLPPCK